MDIQCVQEIRSYESPTRMANTPTFINGVINLRGVIVPIVDMRILFNLASVVYDHFTVVIILNIRSHLVGMVVDSVSDVIALTPSQLRPAPEFTATVGRDHVMGIATVAERMLALLDIEKFMCSADMGLIWPDRQ
jgi:purine-binding chemotaxis protein CheW